MLNGEKIQTVENVLQLPMNSPPHFTPDAPLSRYPLPPRGRDDDDHEHLN